MKNCLTGIISLVVVASCLVGLAPLAEADEKTDRAEWFTEARFGMFVHWGLYSILEGSWDGHTLPSVPAERGFLVC